MQISLSSMLVQGGVFHRPLASIARGQTNWAMLSPWRQEPNRYTIAYIGYFKTQTELPIQYPVIAK